MSTAPFTTALQPLGIKKVDVPRTERELKRESGDQSPTILKLIQFIIEQYNKKNDVPFTPVELASGVWKREDHNGFTLRIYQCVVPIFSSVGVMLGNLGVEVENSKEVSFLLLLSRVHNKAKEIFGLCVGKRGYMPLQDYTDFTFPKVVAIRLLDPDNRSKEKTSQVLGSVLSSEVILRSSLNFDPSLIHKIYKGFTCALRRNASLLRLPEFRNKDGSVPRNPAEIEIKKGVIRVQKQLTLEVFPRILDHFSKISRGLRTDIYPSNPRKKEEGAREAFAFLEYFTAVAPQTHRYLEGELLGMVAECIRGKRPLELDLCHPFVEDYFRATSFRVRYKKANGKTAEVAWEGPRKTFPQLIAILKKIPGLQLDGAGLKKELHKVTLGIRRGKTWHDEPLSGCLVGQMRVTTKEGTQTYFKLNRSWYAISKALLDRVSHEFKRLMGECLLQRDEEGFLAHRWQPQGLELTVGKAAAELGMTEEQLVELCGQKVQYLTAAGDVKFEQLRGEALANPLIFHFRDQIEELLQSYYTVTEEQFIKKAGETYGPKIWKALRVERQLGSIEEVYKSGKKVKVVRILNPLLEPSDALPKKKIEMLEAWAFIPLYTMDEGDYNEGYLYSVNNETGGFKPYNLAEQGWLVGDRICPEGIEIFDVVQFTEKAIYVYHVKEGFGQKTRDACSQLVNSARMFHDKDKVLDTFYEMAAAAPTKGDSHSEYRKKVRTQVRAVGGKAQFKALFAGKPIIFVYAFVDDRQQEHVIEPKHTLSADDFVSKATGKIAAQIFKDLQTSKYLNDKGEKGENFGDLYCVEALKFNDPALIPYRRFVWEVLTGDIAFLGSLIGRMDLLHTRAQIKGMGFGFKVCQIRRPFSLEKSDVLPGIATLETDDIDLADLEEDMHEQVFFYHTPWSEEAECVVPLTTKADGTCGFHAVLGEKKDGVVQCEDAAAVREEFVELLSENLNAEESGFDDVTNQELYTANLSSLIDEASKPDLDDKTDPNYRVRKSAKRVFTRKNGEPVKAFAQFSQKDYRGEILKAEKGILEKGKRGVLQTFEGEVKSGKTQKELKTTLSQDDDEYHKVFERSISQLEELSQSSRTYTWMVAPLASIAEIKEEEEEAKTAVFESKAVMKKFLDALQDPDYWLTPDEVQLVGETYGLRVEVLCADTIAGDYGCTNQHTLLPREADDRELVIVYADGRHYSRCVPFGQDT